MKIKFTEIINNKEVIRFVEAEEVSIIATDDDRDLFNFYMIEDTGVVEVNTYMSCKHKDTVRDTVIQITPKSANVIHIDRPQYKGN